MKMFPIMLDMHGRLGVVVGGGAVGLRKARALVSAGAQVRLVSAAPPGADAGPEVTVVVEAYRPDHLAGAALVFACTDDEALNARIAADARAAGAWVNAVDQPADCDFFVPAVVADGDVTVAIGTGGASPALAGMLKGRVRAALGEEIGAFAGALAELRRDLRTREPTVARRGEIMKHLSSEESLRLFRTAGAEALREKMNALLRE